MKKTLLNSAITMSMATALLSGSVLNTRAYAGEPAPAEPVPADIAAVDTAGTADTDEDYMLPGIGVGAATGAVVAGPVGLIIGGVVGAFVGASQEVTGNNDEAAELTISENFTEDNSNKQTAALAAPFEEAKQTNAQQIDAAEHNSSDRPIHLAQLGAVYNLGDTGMPGPQDELLDAFTRDLSLDIYFRSGSTDIEPFYPARLAAIASLIESMDKLGKDKLELCLDGYADRRGDPSKNITLANERIEKVRQQLVAAGIDENRINTKAFGEMKTVSKAGDLEAYTFDRKVVIRFERMPADSIASMASTLAEFETGETGLADNTEGEDHLVAEDGTRF